MESTNPLGKNLEPKSGQSSPFAPVTAAPVPENGKVAFSRTNSIDSNVSATQPDGADLFAKQRNSARSTKSALSILLAAESEKMKAECARPEPREHERPDIEWRDGATGSNIGSSIDTSNLSRSPSNPSDASHVDMYGQPIRRTGSGSQCISRSKSHSRSNSLSQSSMHSLSDSSIHHERGGRNSSMASMDRKSPFCELVGSQQETDQSISVPHDHHDHHEHHDSHHDSHHHHTNASESARRILASASFDSDLSDGGLGAEFAGSGSDAGSHDFSASDEDEDVQEFDEFADFNAFDHLNGDLHRSGSSGFSNIERVFSASADSFDRAPTTDKLTVKHLVTTILSNELLFQPKSPQSKHKENIATKFLKTSRDSIIGSFTSAKHSILHAHLGLNNESNGTIHSENSDASSVLSTLQQNLTNAASSLPKNLQKKVSKPAIGTQQLSVQQQEQRDIDALLRTRLSLYPAEDDGTPMDDLPEFSGANDILQSGIDDMALMDKVSKSTLLQLHIDGRLEDQYMMLDGLDDSAYYEQQYDSYAVLSPTERAVLDIDATEEAALRGAGRKSEKNGTTAEVSFSFADKDDVFQKSRHRPTVGTTMEVLKYDTNDLSLNPVHSLGYEDRYHSSDGENSSDSDDLRDKFARERSSSNNDIIQMFRTETDDMLQEKIEAALAEEKVERERIKSQSKSARNSEESQLDPQNALKDREDPHSRERSKRKMSSESDEKTTTYITITGRRNADEEWRVVMKIPVRHGRPVVTLPNVAPVTNKAQDTSPNRKANNFVPNSRDIAINTPNKQLNSAKKPNTPSPMPPGRRSHFNSFDLDSATSAAVQAHLNPDFRERKSDTALNAVDLFPANFAPNPTTPGHVRNRSYDFANFSGKFDNSSPLPVGTQDADDEDPGFERRHSNNSQRVSASRSKSIDENPGAYLLNPHTSSSAINFFAMSASASNTPTNTTRKTLSASATHSNNSSGSNLKAALLGATGGHANSSSLSPKGMPPEGHSFDIGPYPVYVHHPVPSHDHTYDGHDTIQISRHSRSNSILSQYAEQHQDLSGTATNRSSISSELSEGSCFSQLHQQLLAAQPSRNSSRSGSVNFINSSNLAGGGFSSDDCSDGGSSSSAGSDLDALADAVGDYDSHHPRHSGHSGRHSGHGVGDGHAHHSHSHKSGRKSGERGKNLPPIDTTINSHHSSHHSSHQSSHNTSYNSSGNRSPSKDTSPTNKTSPVPGQSAPIAPGAQSQFPSSDNTGEASEGASTTGQGEKSSFYFLSRLFGTFRRSTATAITPRASAVNIGIIHEAEFEDSDSSGSNHSSVKEDNVL